MHFALKLSSLVQAPVADGLETTEANIKEILTTAYFKITPLKLRLTFVVIHNQNGTSWNAERYNSSSSSKDCKESLERTHRFFSYSWKKCKSVNVITKKSSITTTNISKLDFSRCCRWIFTGLFKELRIQCWPVHFCWRNGATNSAKNITQAKEWPNRHAGWESLSVMMVNWCGINEVRHSVSLSWIVTVTLLCVVRHKSNW